MRRNIQAYRTFPSIKYLLLFILVISVQSAYSQARLVINNTSFVNINNGSFLVIDNSANNAITRVGTTGWIISEGTIGNNRVKWNVGTNAATFMVPFGFGTTLDLPLTLTTSGAIGSGNIIFSTFRSGVNSISLPTAGTVVPQTMVPTSYLNAGNDNSAFGVDRFYQIDATDPGFIVKPTLSEIIFSYATAEFDASITPNTITEGKIRAEYWDNTTSDWQPFTTLGMVVEASNIVTVPAHSATLVDRSKWWSLVDKTILLPMTLLSFTGACLNKTVELKWITTSELNNLSFTIEKSTDAINWEIISIVPSLGNSTSSTNYSFIDANKSIQTSYYRLKQTDIDGTSKNSSIIAVENCDKNISNSRTSAYFNATQQDIQVSIDSDISAAFHIAVYNAAGTLVAFKDIISSIGKNEIAFEGLNIPAGMYIVAIRSSEINSKHKIIINKL
jgi:hypothetical protein